MTSSIMEFLKKLVSKDNLGEGASYELVDRLFGGIPLPIFSEWWLAKEKFSTIEAFIISLFPGATCQGCNGLSIKYQATLRDTKQTKDGVDKEIVSLRSELKKVKTEATATVDQLQGTESEVRGRRSMTQRMVLTQSEMLCTCIVAWNLILSYFLYILIAVAYHIAEGSCS